jgi:hypothetical protein
LARVAGTEVLSRSIFTICENGGDGSVTEFEPGPLKLTAGPPGNESAVAVAMNSVVSGLRYGKNGSILQKAFRAVESSAEKATNAAVPSAAIDSRMSVILQILPRERAAQLGRMSGY